MRQEDMNAAIELLNTWKRRARMNQRVHYARAEELERSSNWVGIPVILLSCAVGTSIFATIKDDVAGWARIVVGLVSFVSAALAGLQTFFKFPERAIQHKSVAAGFGAVHRSIERALAIPPSTEEDAQALLADLQARLDDLPKQAPAIPDRVWLSTRKELTPELTAPLPQEGAPRLEP